MKRKQIHSLLNSAIAKTTPDCWDKIQNARPLTVEEAMDVEVEVVRTFKPKKSYMIAACSAAVVMLMVFVVTMMYPKSANTYIAIDINPSIELETNKRDQVVTVNAVNKDAQTLLGDTKLIGLDVEDAVDEIIELTLAQGYIKADQRNDILVTISKGDKSQQLLDKINMNIHNLLQAKQIDVKMMNQSIDIDDKLLEKAHNNNVTAGKFTVIQRIADEDDDVAVNQLADASIADLVLYAKKHNVKIDDLIDDDDILDDIDDSDEDDHVKSTTHPSPNLVKPENKGNKHDDKDDQDDQDDDLDDDKNDDKDDDNDHAVNRMTDQHNNRDDSEDQDEKDDQDDRKDGDDDKKRGDSSNKQVNPTVNKAGKPDDDDNKDNDQKDKDDDEKRSNDTSNKQVNQTVNKDGKTDDDDDKDDDQNNDQNKDRQDEQHNDLDDNQEKEKDDD